METSVPEKQEDNVVVMATGPTVKLKPVPSLNLTVS